MGKVTGNGVSPNCYNSRSSLTKTLIIANGAIQSMFEPLHHVLTHEGKVPLVLPSNGFWLRAMTGMHIHSVPCDIKTDLVNLDQAVLELCRAYDIEPDPEGDARKNRAAFLSKSTANAFSLDCTTNIET